MLPPEDPAGEQSRAGTVQLLIPQVATLYIFPGSNPAALHLMEGGKKCGVNQAALIRLFLARALGNVSIIEGRVYVRVHMCGCADWRSSEGREKRCKY